MERGRIGYALAAAAAALLLLGGCANPLMDTVKQIVDNAVMPKSPSLVLSQGVYELSTGGIFDFGSIVQSTTKDMVFTIENHGTADLGLTNIPPVAVAGADFSVTVQPASTVAVGGSASFTLRFSPGTTGPKSGTLYLPSNDKSLGTLTITLIGSGSSSPEPSIQVRQGGTVIPTPSGFYDFGSVLYNTSGAAVTFTIDNIGTATLNLTAVSRSGADAAMFSNTQPSPLAVSAGASVTFTATFSPTAAGSRTANIDITSDDPNKGTYTFQARGVGTAPEINVEQASTSIPSGSGSYSFGGVLNGASREVTFTVENESPGTGNLVLPGSPVTISGADAARFAVTAQPSSPVAVGGSATFKIRFTPGSTGVKTATISIANNDTNESPYTFTVTGTGADAAFVSPSGSASNTGLLSTSPKSTIPDGIAVAQACGLPEVRIALGTYPVSAMITMAAGVSLKGGYSADFSTRSYSNVSKLSSSACLSPVLLADGAAFTNATLIDGLTIEGTTQGGYGIQLNNSAAPTISNNTISLTDTNSNGNYVIGILVNYTGGNVGSPLISGNTVNLNKVTSTGTEGIRGIHIASMASGSGLIVQKNRVTARGNVRTDGIRLASSIGVVLKNNIVSVESTGSACYAVVADNSSLIISNNTVSALSTSSGQYGFYAGSGTTAWVVNNIFCTPRYYGSTMVRNSTTSHGFNLAFNYTSLGSGGTDLGSNQLVTSDIFASVFTGARDTTLADGDQSNYHLSDSGTYAYNLGMNTSSASWGSVADDIDGEARPKAIYFDKGADEK